MAKKKSNNLLNAVLYILVGILLCVFKASVLNWAMTAVGAILIVYGILRCLRDEIMGGVITAAVGVVIIWGGWSFVDLVLLILGVVLAVKGILDLVTYSRYKNSMAVLASILTVIVGVALAINKWALLDWLFIVLGVVLIVDGLLMALGKNKK